MKREASRKAKQTWLLLLFGCPQTLLLYVPAWHNPSLWRKAQQRDKTKDYKAITPNVYHREFTIHLSKPWNNTPTQTHTRNE